MQVQPRPSLRAVLEAGQKRHARAFNKKSSDTGVLGQVMGARDPPPPVPQDADDGFEQFHGALVLATLAASALLAGVRRAMRTPGQQEQVKERMNVLSVQITELQEAARLQEAKISQLQQERDACAAAVRELGLEIDKELDDVQARQNKREQELATIAQEHLARAAKLAARDRRLDEGRAAAEERDNQPDE
jgi:septal ring factor EnvC (AmiA/AmiB activator)